MSILPRDWPADKVQRRAQRPSASLPATRSRSSRRKRVDDDFDARFSATARHYLYRILNRRAPPALERGTVVARRRRRSMRGAMHEAAQTLVGRHDFTTFRSVQCQATSPVAHARPARRDARRRHRRDPRLGPLVPAQPGALDGRNAEARRARGRGRVERRARGARGRRPRAPAARSRRPTGCTWCASTTEPSDEAEQRLQREQHERARPAACAAKTAGRDGRPLAERGVGQPPGQHHASTTKMPQRERRRPSAAVGPERGRTSEAGSISQTSSAEPQLLATT